MFLSYGIDLKSESNDSSEQIGMIMEDLRDRVLNELRTYIARCDRIMKILTGKRSNSTPGCESVRYLYKELKRDLKEASKRGSLLSKAQRKEGVPFEDTIYEYAVRRASNELKPKTNSNPINARWFSAVNDCQNELLYYLERLEGAKTK